MSISSSYKDSSKKVKYRPEIDGLRAFAVVCVIINHFNKQILPGGYLGVDIFFVISGYVITSSICQRPYKNLKDFVFGFYRRRIKRLLPLLLFFVLISGIAICLFNPEPRVSLKTGLHSIFGISNIYLNIRATDYFGESSALNIFTHTWSLGVEEQFYLVFPFFVWFSGFGRQTKNGDRNLLMIFGILAIASLTGFFSLYSVRQPTAYFFMPLRFWEMATGCLLFAVLNKIKSLKNFSKNISTLLVLFLIIGIMYLPNYWASFATFSVVALTSFIIAFIEKNEIVYKIFTNSKVIYLGLISYSLYLWHWAVLVLSRWTVGITFWTIPFQIVLMLALAMASYKWIEQPLRNREWFGQRWKTALVGGGCLISLSGGLFALYNPPLKGKLFTGNPNIQKTPLTNNGISLRTRCLTVTKTVDEILKDCMFSKKGAKQTIWLMGDSHAEAILFGVTNLAKELKMNFFGYFYVLTAFPSTPYKMRNNERMLEASKIVDELEDKMLNKFKKGDIVIINMRYGVHFRGGTEKWLFVSEEGSLVEKPDKSYYFNQWKNNLQVFAKKANAKGVNFIIFTPTPEFPNENRCFGKNDQWFNSLSKEECVIPKSAYVSNYRDLNAELLSLSEKNTNIFLINGVDTMCSQTKCSFSINKKGLYYDEDHISDYGSMVKIFPALMDLVKKKRLNF